MKEGTGGYNTIFILGMGIVLRHDRNLFGDRKDAFFVVNCWFTLESNLTWIRSIITGAFKVELGIGFLLWCTYMLKGYMYRQCSSFYINKVVVVRENSSYFFLARARN